MGGSALRAALPARQPPLLLLHVQEADNDQALHHGTAEAFMRTTCQAAFVCS